MDFTDDLDQFFDSEEFATTFTHLETGAEIDANFETEYDTEDMAETVDYIVLAPAHRVAAVKSRHHLVDEDGKRYEVLTVRPDGTGLAHVFLQRG